MPLDRVIHLLLEELDQSLVAALPIALAPLVTLVLHGLDH